MSSDEKRPTLIRFPKTTYTKLLKEANAEGEKRGQQLTVPKLVEQIIDQWLSKRKGK